MSSSGTYTMSEILTRLGVGGIIIGNTLAAMALDDAFGSRTRRTAVMAGASLAGLGWMIMGIGKSITAPVSGTRVALLWVSLLAVAGSGTWAMWLRTNNTKTPMWVVGANIVSWLLLGTAVAIENRAGVPAVSGGGMAAGLASALAQTIASVGLAPYERKAGITEGFAQVLSMLGWWLFIHTP
nr:hypothetical protein TetV2_00157 [Oceanusvirus sp.]